MAGLEASPHASREAPLGSTYTSTPIRTGKELLTLTEALREFALTPDKFMLIGPDVDRYADDNVCIIEGNTWAGIAAVRVGYEDVAPLVESVRRRIPTEKSLTWFIDPDAQPDDLEKHLIELGLQPASDGGYLVHALVCTQKPPEAQQAIAVRKVQTLADWHTAAEIMWEAHGISDEQRERQRQHMTAEFAASQAAGVPATFLAHLDGRPAGMARSIYSDRGVFLLAGGVAPWARRRDVYRALVRARWDDAVARGTPALVTEALRDTSYPILKRLGFEEVGTIRRLDDPRLSHPRRALDSAA